MCVCIVDMPSHDLETIKTSFAIVYTLFFFLSWDQGLAMPYFYEILIDNLDKYIYLAI